MVAANHLGACSQLDEELDRHIAWMEHMRGGNFAGAWRLSDVALRVNSRRLHWQRPRHEQPIWRGEPFAGQRVLIRCYHGLGDTIQFIRYAPLVRAAARELTVWAQPALLPLLRTVRGIDRFLPLHDGSAEGDYDVELEVMELPHVFRTTLETIPDQVPYIHAPRSSERPNARSHGDLHVGLVWHAGEWERERSVPVELMEPLTRTAGVSLHLLQRGPALGAWKYPSGSSAGSDDPRDTASFMTSLDLVISIDSFPAHLAGALALPVWTLLQARADWRWMEGRSDSPWYPTMRLFRQPRPGDWKSVIDHVVEELRALVQRGGRVSPCP